MRNIGTVFTIILVLGVLTLRFYVKNDHLPFMEKAAPKPIPNQPFVPEKSEDFKVNNMAVYQRIIEQNKKLVLKNPPIIPVQTYGRGQMNNNNSKLKPLCELSNELNQIIISSDFTSKPVRSEAIALASANAGEYNLGQMCNIFDYARGSWKYVNDPIGNEYVAKASETIENKYTGDCDDFAVVLGSMLMAVGGDIRINYAFNDNSGHAFVEANLGNSNIGEVTKYIRTRYNLPLSQSIKVRKDKRTNNLWLNVDWFADFPGGEYFNYKKGTSYYVFDKSCERFDRLTDLIRYEIKGNKIQGLELKKLPTVPK